MAEKAKDAEKPESGVLTERARDPGFWKEIWLQVRLVLALIRDPEVPSYLKLLPLAAILYVVFPLDFAPDIYPILGQLDDLTALLVGAKVFVEMAPPEIVARHQLRLSEDAHRGKEAGGESGDDASLEKAIVIDVEHEIIEKTADERE